MRVCYFGTYRANYPRNQIMIEGLRCNGIEVVECHIPLWHGIEDRVNKAAGGWRNPRFLWRVLRTYWELFKAYRRVGHYDVLMLGYPGYLDVFLARPLAWLAHKPLVLDTFMSIYLIAQERGLVEKSPLTGWLIRVIESLACRLPDLLMLDTAEYVRWFNETHGLEPTRFRLVPTGADDRVFRPIEADENRGGLFRVLYYGTFIPNHGVRYIVEAAQILRDDPTIRFELIGEGPTRAEAMTLAEECDLTNTAFVDWVDRQTLRHKIAQADLCLGVFGITPQSMMTVQNKIYEGLAMARPVVTGDGPAIRQALQHGKHVYLVPRASGKALSEAILTLRNSPDLRQRIAQQGYTLFQAQYAVRRLGELSRQYLEELAV